MKLHLVGGFLGSGKTTAIINSAKALMQQGLKLGVITNDQGKYLVDTAFFQLAAIPSVEVTGGCFCCNYDALDTRLAQLIETEKPDIVFAESVGSCADIVATVVKPLLEIGQNGVSAASFSVFADSRLLLRRLRRQEMPFSDDIVYIFDKQIEEAGLIVVNKMDLIDPQSIVEIQALLQKHFPGKPVLYQTSLSMEGVRSWLDLIQAGELALPGESLEIDYARYGAGEAKLAWLDEELTLLVTEGKGREAVIDLVSRVMERIAAQGAGIGHLKCLIRQGGGVKISIPSLLEPGWEENLPELTGTSVSLLLNARVEMLAFELDQLVQSALVDGGLPYNIQRQSAFHPPLPSPTHRMV